MGKGSPAGICWVSRVFGHRLIGEKKNERRGTLGKKEAPWEESGIVNWLGLAPTWFGFGLGLGLGLALGLGLG